MNHVILVNAIMAYDKKQASKKGHNPYAIGHYLKAVENVEADIAQGMTARDAIMNNFCGRLLDSVLRYCKLPVATTEEHRTPRR